MYIYVIYIYTHIYIHTHTHTHTLILSLYIYSTYTGTYRVRYLQIEAVFTHKALRSLYSVALSCVRLLRKL